MREEAQRRELGACVPPPYPFPIPTPAATTFDRRGGKLRPEEEATEPRDPDARGRPESNGRRN